MTESKMWKRRTIQCSQLSSRRSRPRPRPQSAGNGQISVPVRTGPIRSPIQRTISPLQQSSSGPKAVRNSQMKFSESEQRRERSVTSHHRRFPLLARKRSYHRSETDDFDVPAKRAHLEAEIPRDSSSAVQKSEKVELKSGYGQKSNWVKSRENLGAIKWEIVPNRHPNRPLVITLRRVWIRRTQQKRAPEPLRSHADVAESNLAKDLEMSDSDCESD